jgi:pimeloyl-ACP methyl ester carboxylesterase
MGTLIRPRSEGTVEVGRRRRLGYADFGARRGRTIVWLHGTPGARRQIPDQARRLANRQGLRIIGIDRPGVGDSTPHLYDAIADFASDLACVLDRLGVERCAVVGLSGGGPYALASASVLAERIVTVGILGGVAPTRGLDAVPGGPVSWAVPFAPAIEILREPAAVLLSAVVRLLRPVASQGFDLYARLVPEGDRIVLSDPSIKEMFIDDLLRGSAPGPKAPVYDLVLFTRHWGFPLSSVCQPVHWWHGDADNLVPIAHARHMATRLPDCTLLVRPGESHLGSMGAAEEVVSTVMGAWDALESGRPSSVSAL